MKKVTTLITRFVILTFLAALSARADLIWYDGFQYPDGSLTNVSYPLWIRDSGSGSPSDMYMVNSNLQVTATGGTKISRQDDCMRWLSLTNGGPYTNTPVLLYASFTVICSTAISNGAGLPNGVGTYLASFYSQTNYYFGAGGYPGFGYFGRVQAFTNGSVQPNTWRLGVTDNAKATNNANGGFPVDLAVNTPYQVVEELDPTPSGLQAATIWVNPINIYQTGSSPAEPHYTANDSLGSALTQGVNAYGFRQASSFGNAAFLITNLAVATTFAEAATNVWATNAVSPVIVYQPVGVANFVGSTFALSAVANGQGLGSMTYQWQVSATTNASGMQVSPVNVSGGNFSGANGNILTDNSAQLGDTGYYALVATTPWGLSTTSAVAYVSIALAKVPPSFITEPVSQSVYRGQAVTFSASVQSPGNVTFTWYSNNVVVTAGVNSSGDSSSLELDNVTTNCSANYSVAVTNDYAGVPTNGVVSTNGVLTVLNPPVVSILYLRSLVDVNNGYGPTVPLSQPYQATGTVTTFTNLTTGNTSSYYLQDGTAGINIFVTGGSTFRPAQGAVVTFVGVLSSFGTGLELYADSADNQYPYTSYVDTGDTAPLPVPISIPFNYVNTYGLDYINTNIGGSLVKLSDVYFGTNSGTTISTSGNQIITVTNSSGQSTRLEFFNLDLDTAGQTLPSYAYKVSGVLYGINTNWVVGVTRFADIVTTPAPTPIPLNALFSGGNVTFTWSDASFVLQSSANVTGPYTTIPGASSGFVTNTASGPTMFFRLYNSDP